MEKSDFKFYLGQKVKLMNGNRAVVMGLLTEENNSGTAYCYRIGHVISSGQVVTSVLPEEMLEEAKE